MPTTSTPRTPGVVFAVVVGLLLALTACSAPAVVDPAPNPGCLTEFDPDTDYFPDKSTVRDAANFTLSYHRSYQILTVTQPTPRSYVLLRCGAAAPTLTGELAHAERIDVPVTSLYSASTTQLGLLAELDRTDVVTGVANATLVVNAAVRDRIENGRTVQYSPGAQVNAEAVLAGRPDVLIAGGTDDPGYAKLQDAGIPVIADSAWLEATPLGRAEWVKVMAALTGTEKRAAEVYEQTRAAYLQVAEIAAGTPPVDVLLGQLYQGNWSIPAGGSYVGRLVADAGGRYPWAADTGTGSLQLNFESVYTKAGRSPLWLVTGGWDSLDDVRAADPRYGALTAVRSGQVWSADKTLGPGGGNDYWERGVARPDLVLADLIAILHPALAADHRFAFYRQVRST